MTSADGVVVETDCVRWMKLLGKASPLPREEALRRFPMCVGRLEELGDELSCWHMSSNRLLVIDEDYEFAYTWCHSRSGWNVMEWDMALAVTGRCEEV